MMMLRLARAGTKKRPVYHVVAADRRARRDGRFVEQLGYFVPQRDVLVVDQERIDYWLEKGAQPSETVGKLIKQARANGNTVIETKPTYEPSPGEAEPEAPKAEAAAEAPKAEAAAEAPEAEEPKAEAAAEAPKVEAAAEAPEADEPKAEAAAEETPAPEKNA